MEVKSKNILDGILERGYYIDAPSFLSDGSIAGDNIKKAYKELMTSKLGLRLYEGEDGNGNTLLIFMAANAGVGSIKDSLSSTSKAFPVYISSELTDSEKNNLF